LQRIKKNEAKTQNYSSDLACFKADNAAKVAELELLLTKEIKEIKREVAGNSVLLQSQ